MIFPDVTGTVGRTPLVELGRLAAGVPGRVVAKLEMRNPCGSVKDRLGLALVEDAERRGLLKPLPALPHTPRSFSPPAPKRRANHRRAACRHRRAVRDHCADDRAAQLRPGGCRRHGQRYHQFWRMISWQLLPRGYRANQHWFTPAPNE